MKEPEQSPRLNPLLWGVREVDHLFSAFRRYTKFVFVSKWFLALFALLLMGSLIAWPLITKDRSGIRVSFVGTDTKQGSSAASPVMNNPHYQGMDAKGQQYKVTGLRAVQKTSELIAIEQVNGQLLRANGESVSLRAERADYAQKAGRLDLFGNVTIQDSGGYIFVTPSATVNTATMDVSGTDKVDGNGPQGRLSAIGFTIRENGKYIVFGGRERVTVHLDKMRQD